MFWNFKPAGFSGYHFKPGIKSDSVSWGEQKRVKKTANFMT